MRCRRFIQLAAASLGFLLGSEASGQTVADSTLEVTTWATGLMAPTSFAILTAGPGVQMLVCEKATGRVIHVHNGVIQGTALDVAVNYLSERGLLGIALHPNFPVNGFVYVYYTPSSTASDTQVSGSLLEHRVERYTWNGATLGGMQPILTLPSWGGPNHDGGVLEFGPDGMLYGVIGDLNRDGQLENYPAGPLPDSTAIIFRVEPDGSPPGDNPFVALGARMEIVYAYGVRNSFGLDFDPVSGDLWDTENGPSSYDEINRVLPGFNSGWERIMGPDSRDPEGVGDLWMAAGAAYSDPEFSWLSPVGVTAICFLDGILGAAHEGTCLVGDNNTGTLYRFELDETRTSLVMPTPETQDLVADNNGERNTFRLGSGFGVMPGIELGPDGVYVSSHLTGRIYRIAQVAPTDTGNTLGAPRLRILPNPGAGRTVVRLVHGNPQARMQARIYSPSGQLVRTLHGSGPEIVWDGLDAAGQPLAAGVYLLQLETGALSLQSKIIRVR
jgi:glucose/arabinose dehydrogenase